MRLKNFTLKAHCNSCSHLIHSQPFLVNLDLVPDTAYLEALLMDQFPVLKCCQRCEYKKMTKSYSSYTHIKLIDSPTKIELDLIERAKNQIAATYDFDNNMSQEERSAVREAFQNQLNNLLTKKNIKP